MVKGNHDKSIIALGPFKGTNANLVTEFDPQVF